MTNNSAADSDRWEELHVARLLFGLSADEQAEYDELTRRLPAPPVDELESVVAALDVAWADSRQQALPEELRGAIRVRAQQELSAPRVELAHGSAAGGVAKWNSMNYLPWLVAAACLALALFTWNANRPAVLAVPDYAQLRSELLASDANVIRADWSAGTTPIEGAAGDVIWSSSRQQGFMRFRGLTVNEPSREQYQLWIFDRNQSDKTPIDGGVFDVTEAGEVVVPITAKLHVREAFMFAVTIEKPGGVVVSTRERLPLLAKVE